MARAEAPRLDVRAAEAADRAEWQRMWSANCAHFGASPSAGDDDALWRRIMDGDCPVNAMVCGPGEAGTSLLGLAHWVLHPHTFSTRMVCYLEDLWVEPAARGAGVGRRLIDGLVTLGHRHGWRRIYWHVDADNTAARRLYDRVARATGYVRYDIPIP
ncbi:MAG: GNAT family N-acetyltransferase [Pseudomonadota bacterium]